MSTPRARGSCAASLNQPGRQRGFTLLELIIVLTLIAGIAALLATNIVGRMASTQATGAARQVASALRHTRSQALRTRQVQLLQVDLEARTITAPFRKPIELPEVLEIKLLTASQEVSSSKTGSIRFFPDGGSTGGKITLSTGGRSWVVAVSWLTGEIVVEDSARPRRPSS